MRLLSVAAVVFVLLLSPLSSLMQSVLRASPATISPPDTSPFDTLASPNIIIILTDDLETYPETLQTMPNLQQRLVQEGMSFSNAIVTMPACCPSRTSVLTGQYVHNHGVTANMAPHGGYERFMQNDLETNTIGTMMQAAGYRTVLLGKYLNHYPLEADVNHVPPGWTEWYAYVRGGLFRRYHLNENGTWVKYSGQPEEYSTDVFSAKAVDFIQRHANNADGAPFFMLLNPFAPHYPAHAAPRHDELFADVQAPRTAAYDEVDITDKPHWVQKLDPLTEEQSAFIDTLYRDRLRSMQAVDEMIGTIYDTLIENGQLENTYIIFTSDNGLHLGEHRIVYGKGTAYEAAIRVPFVVRGPDVPANSQQTAVISLVDLAPTIGEIGGVTPLPSAFDGRSLLPLFTNQIAPEAWRAAVLFDNPDNRGADLDDTPDDMLDHVSDREQAMIYFDDEQTVVIGKDGVPIVVNGTGSGSDESLDEKPETTGGMANVGFRTVTYKYVEYKNGDQELYDLVADPLELDNQAANAAPALLAALSTHLEQLHTCAGETCRTADLLVPRSVFPLTDSGVTPTATPASTEISTSTETSTPTAVQPTPNSTPSPLTTSTSTSTPSSTSIPSPAPTSTTTPTPIPVDGEDAEPFRYYLPRIG